MHIWKSNAGGDVSLRVQNDTSTDSGTTASIYLTTSPTDDFNTCRIQARRSDGATTFSYGTTENMRITSGGNVDINGTPPWTVTGGDWRNLSISGQTSSSSGFIWLGNGAAAVSYTHLTLPTIYSV